MPLREVSDASNSPGHDLSKVLHSIFKDYVGHSSTFLKDGYEFINLIKTQRFKNEGFFVSFDADKLHPSIILPEAFDILEAKLKQDKKLHHKTNLSVSQLMRLTKLCADDPYFSCELGLFHQDQGTPMGGPLSTFFADLVIENRIESKIASHPIWGPACDWVRKADDTFLVWKLSIEELHAFHQFLNSLHPTIQWTMQIEDDGKMPFLDILVIKTSSNLETTVYRKPSASDRYTHFTSSQAWREKIIVITTLRKRAEAYCSNNELKQKELQHLESTFHSNGYPIINHPQIFVSA
jgi:hypothetical protein